MGLPPYTAPLQESHLSTEKKQKRGMAKRTDTKIAVLEQVMGELSFDQETVATVTGVPLRLCRISWFGVLTECR